MDGLCLVAFATASEPLLASHLVEFLGHALGSLVLETDGAGIAGARMRSGEAHLALGRLLLLLPDLLNLLGGHAFGGDFHFRVGATIVTATSARTAPSTGSEGAISLPSALGGGRLDHLGGIDAVLVHLPLYLGSIARTGVMLVAASAADGAGLHRLVLTTVLDTSTAGDGLAIPNGLNGGRLLLLKVRLWILSHDGRSLFLDELGLLFLEAGKLGIDVRVDVVGDILTVDDLGNRIETPLLVFEVVDLTVVGSPDAGTAVLPHEVASRLLGGGIAHGLVAGAIGEGIGAVVVLGDGISRPRPLGLALFVGGAQSARLPSLLDRFGDAHIPRPSIAGGGCEHLQTVHHALNLLSGDTTLNASGQELVARGRLDLRHPLLGKVGHLHEGGLPIDEVLDHGLFVGIERLPRLGIDLVDDDDELLVGKQRFDGLEQTDLLLERISTLLGDVDKVQDRAGEMSQGRDGLHFDGIALLEGMIEDAGSVNDLPTQVPVVTVTHEEGFGGECIGLHIDIGAGDLVHERRLADVGEAAHEEGAGVGIEGR
mmetsp:Transcript_1305/g.3751  ORF Transcript_1305/g.3751 Transcript_1305/m.3751 type:complete len:542 (-) Transcript_1305:698-2323(-)